MVLSGLILFGFNHFFGDKQAESQEGAKVEKVAEPTTVALSRDDALKIDANRVSIQNDKVKGSVNLKGARFDDLVLTSYRETVDLNSPEIDLLNPLQSKMPYFVNFGWSSADPNVALPNDETVWSAEGELTQSTPLILTWDNGQGLYFKQVVELDQNYMFKVTQSVENKTDRAIPISVNGQVKRGGDIKTQGFYILHEGPIGVLDGKLDDPSYEDITSIKKNPEAKGWLGFTDKYWLAALVPDQSKQMSSMFGASRNGSELLYEGKFEQEAKVVEPGKTMESENRFFAGAKVLDLLDGYEETLGITHFDLAVDFGWFYFLTKPIFYALDWLKGFLGNFGLAILALTVAFKILFFPLANKSYHAMARLKILGPKMEKIKEQYAGDSVKMNEKLMEFYKKEKVNPASGCLPMLIQIPVFFALYKVLFVSIEMRHAPFFGWIHDLSAPDPTTLFNLFGLLPFTPPSFLMIGAWPLIMGGTMLLQQRISPPPGDPVQARMMMLMPVVFTYMFAQFPAGLVIYWAWNNSLSILQQWFIMRQDMAKNPK